MSRRSLPLQIYLKPGLKDDDHLLRVWEASKDMDRPQDLFRKILNRGLIAMVESGDMPAEIVDACDLDALVARRRKRGSRYQEASQPVQQAPVFYPPPAHYPPQYAPQPAPPAYPHPDYAGYQPQQHAPAPAYLATPENPPAIQPAPRQEQAAPATPSQPEQQAQPVRKTNPSAPAGGETGKRKFEGLM